LHFDRIARYSAFTDAEQLKRLKVKGWDFYIATLTERPAPLYTVGRLQVRTAEESGAIIDGKPPLQPATVVL
jgi:hypothetical protein